MNATVSRFSVLRIEDDEEEKVAQRARDRERAAALKAASKKNDERSKQVAGKSAAKKVKALKEKAELKALAFGGLKHKKPHHNGTKQSQPKSQPSIQREVSSEWKERDEEFLEDVYEQQLNEALLASRLDFEENKEIYEAHKQEVKVEQKMAKKKHGNKKGVLTLSLDEFNLQLLQQQATAAKEPPELMNNEDEHFFDKVTEEARKIASYEKFKTELSVKKKTKSPKTVEISDAPRLAQLEEDLEKAKEEITSLRHENEKLREELLGVKTRSKRLCNILAQGEMREKAELLIEMEKLSTIKDELTAEVENLLSQLQQERSKSSTLSEAKKALKKR